MENGGHTTGLVVVCLVCHCKLSTTAPFAHGASRLQTSQRQSLVSPFSYLLVPHIPLHMGNDTTLLASVVIPTLERHQELESCLWSLATQTELRHEIILIKERGALAALRNEGLRQARAPVVCFIDDDVICPPEWLAGVLRSVQSPTIVGVTGPAIIPQAYRKSRDLFRYRFLKRLHDYAFVDTAQPGIISSAGTFNTIAAEETCAYEGRVDYLEACNMSFKTEAIKAIGGFDEAYRGIGDWSEPDACYRLRLRYGNNCLWFSAAARLEHHPSQGGAYLFRNQDAKQRLDNYRLFASRWVASTLHHRLYRSFLYSYYAWKRCSSR